MIYLEIGDRRITLSEALELPPGLYRALVVIGDECPEPPEEYDEPLTLEERLGLVEDD